MPNNKKYTAKNGRQNNDFKKENKMKETNASYISENT